MRSATLLVALHSTQALLAPSTVTKTPARAAPTATEPEMCRALPWLERPAGLDSLKDADYAMYLQAGDFGFDPLGWAEVGWGLNEGESVEERDDRLYAYREAELKHGRLAMLAAVGWPLSELYDGRLSMRLGMRPELVNVDDSGVGLAPSLLNGGLGHRETWSSWRSFLRPLNSDTIGAYEAARVAAYSIELGSNATIFAVAGS